MTSVAIIGAGAAGCFCAVELKRLRPDYSVTVYESAPKPMAKLAITGGGRCNITNSFRDVRQLGEVYPRGEQLMKRAFAAFDQRKTMEWWEDAGVGLTIQDDQCVFPKSQDAMQVVRTLLRLMDSLGVRLECGRKVTRVSEGFTLDFEKGESVHADLVLLAGGGTSKAQLEAILGALPVDIIDTVPSLFTLKINDSGLRSLMGAVVENATLSLAGTKFRSEGALLITDWGVSGPATLRLSSYAARHLAEKNYSGALLINWISASERDARESLEDAIARNPQKLLSSITPDGLTARIWKHILDRCALREDIRCAELGSKGLARLSGRLVSDSYEIAGRARFKEEFVTCGGVSLKSIDITSLEAKNLPGLFFAGEVLDVDAVTGGFNLQAAWSMARAAAISMSRSRKD